ncbi:hypothetical protein ACVWZL_000610 [Bradyrhizobium sp. GM2.4]
MYHSRHTAVKSAYLLRIASGARRRTVACWAKMSPVDKPADVDKLLTLNIGGATKPAIWMQSLSQGSGAEHSGGDCTLTERVIIQTRSFSACGNGVGRFCGFTLATIAVASPMSSSTREQRQWIRRTSSAMPGSTAALPAACIKELPVPTTRNFTQVGAHVETPGSPDKAVLENAPLRRGDGPPAIVRCTCPEFTSVCPSPVSRVSS